MRQATAIAFGPGGKRYMALPGGGIKVLGTAGGKDSATVIAKTLSISAMTVSNHSEIYASVDTGDGHGELWLISPEGQTTRLDGDIKGASGVALSPDKRWLFVAQRFSHLGLSYRIATDGRVDARESFYEFYVPAGADDSGAGAVAMDRDGRAYVATRGGVQIFDRNGRVTAILTLPHNEAATGVCFGGASFDTLFVATGKAIYSRKLSVHGITGWSESVTLPAWGPG